MTLMLIALAVGCRTVESDRENRPWYEPALDPASIPWYLPTGPSHWGAPRHATTLVGPVDYHNAHGAGWWDAPWVLAEQAALAPTYVLWGIGDALYEDILVADPEAGRDQWQWKAVNWTLGPIHAVLSTANLAVVLVADTLLHDPVAAIWWSRGAEPPPAADTGTATAP